MIPGAHPRAGVPGVGESSGGVFAIRRDEAPLLSDLRGGGSLGQVFSERTFPSKRKQNQPASAGKCAVLAQSATGCSRGLSRANSPTLEASADVHSCLGICIAARSMKPARQATTGTGTLPCAPRAFPGRVLPRRSLEARTRKVPGLPRSLR